MIARHCGGGGLVQLDWLDDAFKLTSTKYQLGTHGPRVAALFDLMPGKSAHAVSSPWYPLQSSLIFSYATSSAVRLLPPRYQRQRRTYALTLRENMPVHTTAVAKRHADGVPWLSCDAPSPTVAPTIDAATANRSRLLPYAVSETKCSIVSQEMSQNWPVNEWRELNRRSVYHSLLRVLLACGITSIQLWLHHQLLSQRVGRTITSSVKLLAELLTANYPVRYAHAVPP